MTWPILPPAYSGLHRSIQVFGGLVTISGFQAMHQAGVVVGQSFGDTSVSGR